MTHKARILKTIRGEKTDRVPFIPRLDIWYNANKKSGTLPEKYKNASLIEITDDLGLGYHSVVPAFRDFINEDEGATDIGLGVYRFRALPYAVKFHEIKRKTNFESGGVTVTEYITPRGTLTTRVRYDERMKSDGATLSVILEHAVKGPRDYDAAAFIFENAEITPDYDYYKFYADEIVGERGVAVACAAIYASPMHFLLKELMPIENFFVELHENPDELKGLARGIKGYCDKIFTAASGCPADIILSGANYDSAITTPPFFREFIAPELTRQSKILREKGKFLATHADGENDGLLEMIKDCGVDLADSICPAPMTRKTLSDVMEVFGGAVTVWGGIPSVCMLKDSMNDYEFDEFLNLTMECAANGGVILGIADTVPPGADFGRIIKIDETAKKYGVF